MANDIPRNAPPTRPGPYWIHCSRCRKFDVKDLEQEDIDDGCRDGTLICSECFRAATQHITKADMEAAAAYLRAEEKGSAKN